MILCQIAKNDQDPDYFSDDFLLLLPYCVQNRVHRGRCWLIKVVFPADCLGSGSENFILEKRLPCRPDLDLVCVCAAQTLP